MRIAIVGSAHPFRGGGLTTFNMILARELQKQGHTVKIFTFSLQYPSFLFPGKSQYTEEPGPEDLDIEICLNSINPYNWFRTGKLIRKWQADVVIFRYWLPFMGPSFGTLARIIKRKSDTKIIAIADNIVPHEKRPGDKLFTQWFISACDGVLAMSQSVLEDARKFLRPNQDSIYHPHPLYNSFGPLLTREEALEKLNLSPDLRYLLFFGFVREYKGLDLLLEAFADQEIERLPIRLMIAGEFYCDPAPYEALISKLKLENRLIRHHEFISDAEVNLWFSACDMVVQTYKHATQSGVTQVAYYYSKPMLVTDVGGLAELIPDQKVGYVVKPHVNQIVAALSDFFTNNRLQEFTNGANLERSKYSWEAFIKSLLHVVHQKKSD